jgi:hypothetical protein
MAAENKTFPQIGGSAWKQLRHQFKKAIPGVLSSTYLASVLGISDASAKGVYIPTLRLIGLIDKESKTNQDYAKRMRDDSSYPKFCEELIRKVYPQELLDIFPDKKVNKSALRSWFMNHSGAGESAAGKMASFYSTLLEADIENKPSGNGQRNQVNSKQAKTNAASQKKASLVAKPLASSNQPQNDSLEASGLLQQKGNINNNNYPELNINIQIHISSDASSDQIKSIFENMSKHLYNR